MTQSVARLNEENLDGSRIASLATGGVAQRCCA